MKRQRTIKLGSSLENLFQVDQFVEEISDEHMLYGSYFGNILMAVTEAVQNAMTHGNGLNEERLVYIKEEMNEAGLWITVKDEGAGFNYSDFLIKNRKEGFNSEKTGILLIQTLCDEVRFLDEGRTIEMLFRINGIDDSIFSRRQAFMHDFFKVYQRLNT